MHSKQAMPSKQSFHYASIGLTLLIFIGVLQFNLLVAFLAMCGTFALARHLPHTWLLRKSGQKAALISTIVVAAVPVLTLVAVGLALSYLTTHASLAYAELINHLNDLIGQWRGALPDAVASHLPSGPETIKPWLTSLIQSQANTLTTVGKSGAHGILMAFLGMIIGLLLANSAPVKSPASLKPLSQEIYARAIHVQQVFEQVIRAQLWIASINTGFTVIFFYVILPLMGTEMPYSVSLLLLTFFAGLLPVVGNLVCNTITTLVALTVSPLVAGAALIFLILVHKSEYFINAKIIGTKMSMKAWELLIAMFIMEAIFGASGLVIAPLLYPYLKMELKLLNWI